MQAAPARYVSVSELYSTDEVELLLDEIRELEPTSCRGEDVQDFEIAGSGCGGGRSPAGTELTERSWDSHAQYLREPPPRPEHLAPVYCHTRYLVSLEGFFTFIIVLCSVTTCCVLWGAGGVRLGAAARPLALGALSSALVHGALLTLRTTRLHRLLPLDWRALGMYSCVWTLVSTGAGASLLLHSELAAHAQPPPPSLVQHMHFSAVGVGYCGALAGAILGGALAWRAWAARREAGPRGAYRAVPTASPAPAFHHTSTAPL